MLITDSFVRIVDVPDALDGPASQFLIYRDDTGAVKLDVRVEDETVWLSQQSLAELFQVALSTINEHIQNIYDEGELEERATERTFVMSRLEGARTVNRPVLHYNLDMIISVGYRVKSRIATRFRIWATQQLRELIVKGFVLDDERLKEGRSLGRDYFAELLQRIRDIRASEKRFYQQLRDLFALSIDYDETDAAIARQFVGNVQNKMLYAVTGHTAAEIIGSRSDSGKANMGLTTWEKGRVRKRDVTVAKNYLDQPEIDELNRIVVMFLDFAEDRARRGIPMHMADWMDRLDAFLRFNEREVLTDLGKVERSVADRLAHERYEQFDAERRNLEKVAADEDDIAMLTEYVEELEGRTS
jgi:hypothetical protein